MPTLDKEQQKTRSAFSKSLFWLGSAQVLGRIVRLACSIIIARLLTPEVFGEVAIILTCFELICTPTRRITSASLIKMDDQTFNATLPNANKINWMASITAFVAMSLLSWPLAIYHQDLALIPPMILMATSYLLLPFGMLHAASNLKQNKMRIVGRAILWQTIGDSILTASLALLGLGIWAIIIPKVLVILIWVGIHRYNNPLGDEGYANKLKMISLDKPNQAINSHKHAQTGFIRHQISAFIERVQAQKGKLFQNNAKRQDDVEQTKKLTKKLSVSSPSTTKLLSFGSQVGLSDLSIALRQNIDYLLVGYFLGIEALGVYFFAFNASLGISTSIVQGFGTALYSHLCTPKNPHSDSQDKQSQADKKLNKTDADKDDNETVSSSIPVSSEIKSRYTNSLSLILKLTVPIVLLQAALSPFYLPFVYGEQWISAGALPVFILLCLSGLVRPLGEAVSQLLISINKQQLNLKLNFGFTILLVTTICIFSQWGLQGVALGILIIHLVAMPAVSIYVHLFILNSSTHKAASSVKACTKSNSKMNNKINNSSSKAFNQEVSHDA
ncbi:oligosaccharide flippase family protein [Shewanella sp. UCD-KL12]|uniref:oligosaccharide flippase family protein n=1 Tax=Shewanella sp. UCD-KL12 TaxID=1917163 RepID=UPI00097100B5|nr:oligosaccharide flippase family protein [Shewanella sp. UCD-KL12]